MKSKYLQWGFGIILIGMANAVTVDDGIKIGATNTVPAGSNSIALGNSNTANNSSLAIGVYNVVDNCSLAVGESSAVTGYGSMSIGGLNEIDLSSVCSLTGGEGQGIKNSQSSVALGYYNSLEQQVGSAVLGVGNSMAFPSNKWGTGNVMLGLNNRIDGMASTTTSNLQGTVLLGSGNISSSGKSFAFGVGNIAQSETVTVGTYAQTVDAASLIVGNGTDISARSNGLIVLKNGEVQIPGSLVVGGSPTLTLGDASSFMQNQGFLHSSALSSALNNLSSPPTSSIWTSTYLQRGNIANGGALAIGLSSIASAQYSTAIGDAAVASGYNSFANGPRAIASGYCAMATGTDSSATASFSTAVGFNAKAIGLCSQARGYWVSAKSRYETVFGTYNLESTPASFFTINGLDGLFRLGNGDSTARSDALKVLKNGQTTLTNKEWKAHPATPLADPVSTTDSGGEALVVEGHARLKGKVIIEQAQGDISMGIYGN